MVPAIKSKSNGDVVSNGRNSTAFSIVLLSTGVVTSKGNEVTFGKEPVAGHIL